MSAPPGFDWQAELARKLDAQVATFGREVTYVPSTGPSYVLSGILDSGEAAEARFPGAKYALLVPRSALAAEPTKEDEAEVDSRRFRVADVQREAADAGGVWLLLTYVRT